MLVERRWLRHNWVRQTGALCALVVSFWLVSCSPNKDLTEFRFNQDLQPTDPWQWLDKVSIDSGSTKSVNNETDNGTAIGCMINGGNNGLLASGSYGCMQSPAISFYGTQWLIGFPIARTTQDQDFSIYNVLSSAASYVSPSLLDAGTASGARYVKYATLTNGDIISTFLVDGGVAGVRLVYANVFNVLTQTWSGPVQLGTTGMATDFGSDGLNDGTTVNVNSTAFCRPTIGTAGDGSAMIAWCEDTAASANGQSNIKYRKYNGGTWTPAIGSNPSSLMSTASTLYFPGFVGQSSNISSDDLLDTDGNVFLFSYRQYIGGVTYTKYVYSTASTGVPTSGIFQIATDGSGTTLYCSTLVNLANSILSQKPKNYTTGAQDTLTLAQQGFSASVDPNCDEGTPATYNISFFYNKSLSANYINSVNNSTEYIAFQANTNANSQGTGSTLAVCDTNLGGTYTTANCTTTANLFNTGTNNYFLAAAINTTGGNAEEMIHNRANTGGAGTIAPYNHAYKSAMVSVSGDGYGNYALIRSVVSPYFDVNAMLYSDVGYSRLLVGHQYLATSGWTTFSSTGSLFTQKVSQPPYCYSSSSNENLACSVRNPKILLSSTGKGIVLYHQNQPTEYTSYTSNDDSGKVFKNRLWYSTYSTSNGFSSSASILDENEYCDIASLTNDVPVCETGSYTTACNNLHEINDISSASATGIKNPVGTSLDHDVPEISAKLTSNGKGIVSYHKKVNIGTISSPNCQYVGTKVRLYNVNTGFDNEIQVDQAAGNTMHSNVCINSKGNAAVVWEEIRNTTVYLNAKVYKNGSWSSIKALDSSATGDTESMMPSCEINESDEVLVSYSLGLASSARRQYVRKFTNGTN